MNIDNQLLLGIVFITAGVAMGLLAYAAFLNRQQDEEEEMDPAESPSELQAAEPEAQVPAEAAEESSLMVVAEEAAAETAVADPQPDPIARAQPTVNSEGGVLATGTVADPETVQAPETISRAEPDEPKVAERPTVLVDRDKVSGRVLVKVDDRVYHSMESLRESEDWGNVTDLFSDLLAWMIKVKEEKPTEEEAPIEDTPHRPISMVQEINQILSEKLADVDSGPAAVRLMEGVGGSIRVYIGVESYGIEEVPDAEVKALIRQAVKEWEERQ